MPQLTRDDGVQIRWGERGEGPPAVISPHANSHPSVFEPLIAALEPDHRVVTYDARGYGRSTRRGPHDMDTGADDLAAVAGAVGGGAIVVSLADACCRAVRVAAAQPDLVVGVIGAGTAPVRREELQSSDAIIGSDSVVEAFLEQMSTNYRAAVRTLMAAANPQMSEEEVRERVNAQVDYAPREAVLERLRGWEADDAVEFARTIGDRLWLLTSPNVAGPWFPSGGEFIRLIKPLLPQAHLEQIADGIVSRPDLTAAIVRRITASSPAAKRPTAT